MDFVEELKKDKENIEKTLNIIRREPVFINIEGGLSDIEAINKLRSQTTPELIEKLENYYIR